MPALLERGSELSDFIPAVGGAIFGALAALLLSHLLVEATVSPFFAGCVSLLLLLITCLSIQRAFTIEAVPPPDLLGEEGEEADDFVHLTGPSATTNSSSSSTRGHRVSFYQAKVRARRTLYGLSLICFIGSVCSLLLPRCRGTIWPVRAPLYCFLGNALCLVLVLAVADGLQLYIESASTTTGDSYDINSNRRKRERLCHVLVATGSSSMPEEYKEQLWILLCGSLVLGGAFGFFFAVLDGGDAASHINIVRYRYVCVPLSVLICSLLGIALNRTGPPTDEPTQQTAPVATRWGRKASNSSIQEAQKQQQQQRRREEAFVDEAAEEEAAFFIP